MLRVFDPFEVRSVSLPEDTEEPKTVFKVGRIDAILAAAIFDDASRYGVSETEASHNEATIKLHTHRRNLQIVRFGLQGWERFPDAAGKDLPFDPSKHQKKHTVSDVGERTGLTDEALNLLRPYVASLAVKIEEFNRLTKEQEKNSSSPSS